MKQSKYNFFLKIEDGNYLAFNALKNGLAVVDEEVTKKINSLEAGNVPDINDELLGELKKGGFICEDNYDEYGVITIRRHMQQYSSTGLGLTIAPTLNCNLACKYCFENPDPGVMNNDVIKGLLKYVKDSIESGKKSFTVAWYGGEPLLCMEIIERLSKKFISMCKKNKVEYSAFIITNGIFYNREIAERLKELNITRAQITIDGDKETHDIRRPFRGGQGSFEQIFRNVKDAVGVLPIILRTNVDTTNVDKVLSFYRRLKNEEWFRKHFGKMIFVHYGYVRKLSASCKCSEEESLKPGDFYKKELELHKYLYKNGLGFNYYPRISSGCCATSINSYLVAPTGEVFKCWNHVGIPGKSVGTVFEPIELNPFYTLYLKESFENDPECKECKCLPICMGGCVDVRVKAKQGELSSKDCASWKYSLEESLRHYYSARMKNDRNPQCSNFSNDKKN